MCGAAAALAAVIGAARMKLPVAVDAWLALAENSIGPNAYRPDEVATAANGKRIEIVHTDAEGRMVLADALTFASREKPDALISFATLTGTMCVALGERMSGFFADDEKWRARALAAAEESGERLVWFPAPEDYAAALKSDVADIKQCGEDGAADHIMAVLFLREFIAGKIPWTHLDLSAATLKGGLGAAPSTVTGFGAAWGFGALARPAMTVKIGGLALRPDRPAVVVPLFRAVSGEALEVLQRGRNGRGRRFAWTWPARKRRTRRRRCWNPSPGAASRSSPRRGRAFEGGEWRGDENTRRDVLLRALDFADAVDIELASGEIAREVVSAAKARGGAAIVSRHNFSAMDSRGQMDSALKEAAGAGPRTCSRLRAQLRTSRMRNVFWILSAPTAGIFR